MEYREALASDIPAIIPAIAKLRAITWESEEYWMPRITSYLAGQQHPQKALAARVAYVAIDNKTVVGFIAGHLTRRFNCDGELQWIDVLPSHRGTGVASELLRRLAKWFSAQNALRICVDVDPKNTAAQNFYRRHGAVDLKPHWLVWNDVGEIFQKSDERGS